ncbi:MAG TPA: M14 family zinc carboxypeptidase, partial [Bacteroidales bacterium]|nr:M14 family zinc carboxypeptidase [Bacteroidales bacterium]
MKKYLTFIVTVMLSGNIIAQKYYSGQTPEAAQILNTRGEIVVRFVVSEKSQINNDLTNILSIDHVKQLPGGQGYQVRAYANQEEYEEFLTRNIPYEIIPKLTTKALTMANTLAEMATWDKYPTYSVYEQMMANFATSYPGLCDIDTILSPTPSGNYKILVAKISDNINSAEDEPQFLYTSSMHGDETTGYYLMLRLINYLLSNYGSDAQVTNLVNNVELWICPLANPDGTYYMSNPQGSTLANSIRYNKNFKDLNRNYFDPIIGNPNNSGDFFNYPIQPETYAFM